MSSVHGTMATKNVTWCCVHFEHPEWKVMITEEEKQKQLWLNTSKALTVFDQIWMTTDKDASFWADVLHPRIVLGMKMSQRLPLDTNMTFNMFAFKQNSYHWCTLTVHVVLMAWQGQTPHSLVLTNCINVRVRSRIKMSSSEKASFVSPPDKRRGWTITWNSPCLGCTSGRA